MMALKAIAINLFRVINDDENDKSSTQIISNRFMLFNELQLCVDKIEMLEQLLAQPRPQKMLRECTFDMIWPMLALLF